ncbi:NYN domain-containing protein [Cellulomonas sp. DKR-3]|uniref:NYN domain-containing protein n=1 Tax=Cellulomonas fulva TaxID=2835530 RepID=A0ABS5U1R4_9CELL|nr:NYN domain-containing protein [Cellulomonas fulva]MBT0995301.1 NYN domain-containing protein [Cellulomonas fulva]
MPTSEDDARVGVYIDFDNIVISRYDQVHGDGAWRRDNARDARPDVTARLEAARVDVSALLDFASSFGTLAVTRAYADWSVPANAAYRRQLVERAIDLTQLFPASGTKNGADIRLAVDVLEDLFRLADVSHVVIVAGDSDYIALAQRCKRLGRVVVGIGVPGGTSRALISACDEFEYYDEVAQPDDDDLDDAEAPADAQRPEKSAAGQPSEQPAAAPRRDEPVTAPDAPAAATGQPIGGPGATRLLVKALGLVGKDADGWSQASAVKQQMKRLNPQYNEAALGFATFTDFVRSRNSQVELREDGQSRSLRLRTAKPKRG